MKRVYELSVGNQFLMLRHQYEIIREDATHFFYRQVMYKLGAYKNCSWAIYSFSKKSQQWVGIPAEYIIGKRDN